MTAPGGSLGIPLAYAPQLLDRLDRGNLFKRVASIYLKANAVLNGLVGAAWAIVTLGLMLEALTSDYGGAWLKIGGFLGGVLGVAVIIAGTYGCVHIGWLRSATILEMPDTDLKVLPVMARLIKALGEIAAVSVLMVFLYFGASALMGSGIVSQFMWAYGGSSGFTSFIVGLVSVPVLAVAGVIVALLVLMMYYLVAEGIEAISNIARDSQASAAMLEKMSGADN